MPETEHEVEIGCPLCFRGHRVPYEDGDAVCPKKRRPYRVVFGKVRSKSSRGDKKNGTRQFKLRARHAGSEELWEWSAAYDEENKVLAIGGGI
jgi:hypothetical protein